MYHASVLCIADFFFRKTLTYRASGVSRKVVTARSLQNLNQLGAKDEVVDKHIKEDRQVSKKNVPIQPIKAEVHTSIGEEEQR